MNIIKMTTYFLLAAFLLLSAACGEQKKETNTTMEDVKKEAQEAVETAGSYSLEQQQVYQRKLADKLAEYDRNIATLRQQLGMVTAAVGQKSQEKLDMLQANVDDMKKKVEELKNASGKAREDLRIGLEKAGEELDKSFSEAMKNFK